MNLKFQAMASERQQARIWFNERPMEKQIKT